MLFRSYSESLLASRLGNWETFAESVNRMNDSNIRYSRKIKSLYSPDASGMAKEFLYNAELSEVRKTGQKLKTAILILTVILLFSYLIVVILRLKAREKEVSLLRRLAEMDRASRQTSSDFMSALESMATEKMKLNERIVSLENERHAADGFVIELREVMALYDEYLHTPSSQGLKATKKKLIQQAASLSNPEFEDSLVRFTDIRHNSVITRLRELGYNRNERVLLCCLLNEFPMGLIALLFNVDSTVIYTRKSRLKAKLQSSGITNLPCF